MNFLRSLVLCACAASMALAADAKQQGILGFNSGSTLTDKSPKQESDFKQEFETAQKLQHSPGKFASVRLYTNIQSGTTDEPISAFSAALETNTTMLLGIWCSGTDSIANELKALKSAIDKHGQKFADLVVGISVGSEDLYRVSESGIENKAGLGKGPKQIVAFVKEVRKTLASTSLKEKPVGHVDSWSAWSNSSNKAVIQEVDFIGVDLYPYYEKNAGNSFSNMTNVFEDIYNRTMKAASDKPVWITETGWPSEGPKFGDAEASLDNAKGYWQEIGCRFFGRTNVWWYNLRDSNPDNKEKFAITDDLSTKPNFNLSCPADSGAPASINNESAGSSVVIATSLAYLSGALVVGLFWW